MDPADEDRLKELIVEHTLLRDTEEGFTLASGRKSTYLFNLKNLFGDPEAARLMTARLLEALDGLEFDYVAGPELGAVFPIACAVVQSHDRDDGSPVRGFVVRKQEKGHGSKNRVEGLREMPGEGDVVVVVEDVTTTGASLLDAVEVVRGLGCTVTHAVTLVDRKEGAAGNLAAEGVELSALFTRDDFLEPDVT